MRRSGKYSLNDMLSKIYGNMRPEYKLMVRRDSFHTISELIHQAEGYESYLREKKNFRPPPNPAQSWIPETAYYTRNRGPRNYHVDSLQMSPLKQEVEQRYDKTPHRYHTNFHKSDSKYNQPPYFQNLRSREHNTASVPTKGIENKEYRIPICWNCEKQGHRFNECKEPRIIRCYNCKKEGMRTVNCPCRSENDIRGRKPGGVPSLDKSKTPPVTGQSG